MAIAIIPKSFGAISLAKIIETIMLTIIPEYFSIALQNNPLIICCFKDGMVFSISESVTFSGALSFS